MNKPDTFELYDHVVLSLVAAPANSWILYGSTIDGETDYWREPLHYLAVCKVRTRRRVQGVPRDIWVGPWSREVLPLDSYCLDPCSTHLAVSLGGEPFSHPDRLPTILRVSDVLYYSGEE